jgi:TRAP-type C4-dicarboxylate transport system permease small subunit
VLAVILSVMVVLNFAGVVFRYWIHLSLPWTEEVLVGLFLWMVFVGAGVTVVTRMHLGFAALSDLFPVRLRRGLTTLGRLAFAAFFVVLAWYGGRMVLGELAYDQRTPTLGWPEAVLSGAVPVGAALALARMFGARTRSSRR